MGSTDTTTQGPGSFFQSLRKLLFASRESYDHQFYPPAPTCKITVSVSTNFGNLIGTTDEKKVEFKVLLDTGADMSCIPSAKIDELEDDLDMDLPYGNIPTRDFHGKRFLLRVFDLRILAQNTYCFEEEKIQFAEINSNVGILGRDVLNKHRIVLDGPKEKWKCRRKKSKA